MPFGGPRARRFLIISKVINTDEQIIGYFLLYPTKLLSFKLDNRRELVTL